MYLNLSFCFIDGEEGKPGVVLVSSMIKISRKNISKAKGEVYIYKRERMFWWRREIEEKNAAT